MPAYRFPPCFHRKSRRVNPTIPSAAFSMQIKYKRLSPHVTHTSPFFSSVFHTASALSAPTGHLPLEGKAIKLSGRTFLAPHRGSSPMGLCKRTRFLGVKRRENPVRRHFERSEMRGAAWRYCMKESGKERLKQVIYESTRAPFRVNLYKGRCPIKNHSSPFLWKGQTSEARRGWHPRV